MLDLGLNKRVGILQTKEKTHQENCMSKVTEMRTKNMHRSHRVV